MGISNTEIARRKITRGSVLAVLYDSQSAPMMVSTLELALLPANPEISSEMVPCINFLTDRGYIAVVKPEEPTVNPMRGVLVRITDKGQDVVEGTVRDASIIFADGR